MNKQKLWSTIDVICSVVMILIGFIGLTINLIRIDEFVMNYFGWFMVMNATYAVAIALGWDGLLNT